MKPYDLVERSRRQSMIPTTTADVARSMTGFRWSGRLLQVVHLGDLIPRDGVRRRRDGPAWLGTYPASFTAVADES